MLTASVIYMYVNTIYCELESSALQTKAGASSISENVKPEDLYEDDLAVEIENEYDPTIPNSYEQVLKERRSERDKVREEEVRSLQ